MKVNNILHIKHLFEHKHGMSSKHYRQLIPSCCIWRTTQEHIDGLLLCYGVVCGQVAKNGYCYKCSENKFYNKKSPRPTANPQS